MYKDSGILLVLKMKSHNLYVQYILHFIISILLLFQFQFKYGDYLDF